MHIFINTAINRVLINLCWSRDSGIMDWLTFKPVLCSKWSQARSSLKSCFILYLYWWPVNEILDSDVGCYMGEDFLGVLGYADDIVLIAPSPSAMRKLLAICDGYASDYDIIFNADKSKSIVFVSPNRRFLVKSMNSRVFILVVI